MRSLALRRRSALPLAMGLPSTAFWTRLLKRLRMPLAPWCCALSTNLTTASRTCESVTRAWAFTVSLYPPLPLAAGGVYCTSRASNAFKNAVSPGFPPPPPLGAGTGTSVCIIRPRRCSQLRHVISLAPGWGAGALRFQTRSSLKPSVLSPVPSAPPVDEGSRQDGHLGFLHGRAPPQTQTRHRI